MTGRLDWAGLLRTGLQHLQLKPGEFWQLTPAELLMMLGDSAGAVPLAHRDMRELMRRWPDRVSGGKQDEGAGDGRRGQDRVG